MKNGSSKKRVREKERKHKEDGMKENKKGINRNRRETRSNWEKEKWI